MVVVEGENPIPGTGNLWFPGITTTGFPVSARAKEIAKSRDELILLLRDVPECDYELSLTDLVEKKSAVEDSVSDSKRVEQIGRKNRSKTKLKSASHGVLLNVFVPVSLKRGFSRSVSCVSDRSRPVSCASDRTSIDCNNREKEKERVLPGCWPVIWERSRSRREGR
ncbi:uncharacterized protein LOC143887205 [Tasmannia lanceolata]|uniref:uncharacterized protein LOC143887205 n=1 Tax=Tasmannia lanceolata TaxID=3420 RepID=UPI0040629A92